MDPTMDSTPYAHGKEFGRSLGRLGLMRFCSCFMASKEDGLNTEILLD